MADDSTWLKKKPVDHPFRENLRKSGRFYVGDMNDTVLNNTTTGAKKASILTRMPRRSRIPAEKIKEMNFKAPSVLLREPRPNNRKPSIAPSAVGRPSISVNSRPHTLLSSRLNRSGLQFKNSGFLKKNDKGSQLLKSINNVGLEKETAKNYDGSILQDSSILSGSKIGGHSTPNEAACIRSILKQSENTRVNEEPLSKATKTKAAKRVNFGDKSEAENIEEPIPIQLPFKKGICTLLSSIPKERGKVSATDTEMEETTVTFENDFKPLSCEEEKLESNVLDFWSTYRGQATEIRTKMRMADENFRSAIEKKASLKENLAVFEAKKQKLYEKLREIEEEFREKVNGCVNVIGELKVYIDKREKLFEDHARLEDDFTRTLTRLVGRHGDLSGQEGSQIPGLKKAKQNETNQKSISTADASPDNTPARRKRLSRKVENQLKILFQE